MPPVGLRPRLGWVWPPHSYPLGHSYYLFSHPFPESWAGCQGGHFSNRRTGAKGKENALPEIDGETVSDFIFLGSKITADGDCSHEIKRCLLLGRKVMTNLDSIFKSRDITLPTKVCLVKAMVFPVVMYGCESWTG